MSLDLPTSRDDWRLVGRTVRLVLGDPRYATLAATVAIVAAVLMAIAPNLAFNVDVVLLGDLPLSTKMNAVLIQLPFFGPAEPIRGALLYTTAAFVGANVALLAYHLLEHQVSVAGGSGSAAGVVLGTLGAGCAACGPAILAGVIGLLGGASLLAALPYDGLEFSALAIAVLVLSMYWLADGMRGGEIRGCPVERSETGLG